MEKGPAPAITIQELPEAEPGMRPVQLLGAQAVRTLEQGADCFLLLPGRGGTGLEGDPGPAFFVLRAFSPAVADCLNRILLREHI